MNLPISLLSLVGVNLYLLFEMLNGRINVFQVILLYWFENVIIGIFNVAKMALAKGDSLDPNQFNTSKYFRIPFFIVHYGMFCLVHGIFLFFIISKYLPNSFQIIITNGLLLFLSHGFSFIHNYLISGEYKTAKINSLFFQPYKRVVLVHLVIMIGFFLTLTNSSNTLLPIILIVLKIIIDSTMHIIERLKFKYFPNPVSSNIT